MDSQDKADLKEIVARSRRIETRLTRYLEAQGLDTGIQRPYWHPDGSIILSSPANSLETLVRLVPRAWPAHRPIPVVMGDGSGLLCQIIVQ